DRGALDLTTGDQFVAGGRDEWSTLGVFGTLNYAYHNKYSLAVTGRYEGAARLSPTPRSAVFPPMSAGSVITQEPFMQPVTEVMSFLKLRGSWGAIGNQNAFMADIYRIMATSNSGWLVGGINQPTVATPGALPTSLTWETVTTLDLGADVRFFQDRLGA